MTPNDLILVVEDDEDVRYMLCLVLEVEGFRTSGASDGLDALERLRSGEVPAAIILDLRLPRMSGADFLKTLRADTVLSRIPVLVLSGDSAAEREALALDAADFLAKPVDMDELVHRVSGLSALAA